MAEQAQPKEAEFVTKLVGEDPSRPPETVLVSGYPGRSSEADHHRLYLDPQLDQYLEIPADAWLHHQPEAASGALVADLVWIRRDAELALGRSGGDGLKTRVPAASLLSGWAGAAPPAASAPAWSPPAPCMAPPAPCAAAWPPASWPAPCVAPAGDTASLMAAPQQATPAWPVAAWPAASWPSPAGGQAPRWPGWGVQPSMFIK